MGGKIIEWNARWNSTRQRQTQKGGTIMRSGIRDPKKLLSGSEKY